MTPLKTNSSYESCKVYVQFKIINNYPLEVMKDTYGKVVIATNTEYSPPENSLISSTTIMLAFILWFDSTNTIASFTLVIYNHLPVHNFLYSNFLLQLLLLHFFQTVFPKNNFLEQRVYQKQPNSTCGNILVMLLKSSRKQKLLEGHKGNQITPLTNSIMKQKK